MTLAESKTAHMRVLVREIAEGREGVLFFAAPTRAKFLIGRGEAAFVNQGPAPADTGILRRSAAWPFNRFSTVVPGWAEFTAVILGGGPSLTREQVEGVRAAREANKVRVICVNDTYLLAPWADILYAADTAWWAWHAEGVRKDALGLSAAQVRKQFEEFAGERCSIQCTGAGVTDAAIHILRNKHFPIHGNGISLDPGALVTGRNSGHQALNLAILAGSKTVILLGFDGKIASDGRTHWHGAHPQPTPVAAYEEYRRAFAASAAEIKAAGVRVLNCAPGSEVGFELMSIEDAMVEIEKGYTK